MSNNPTPARPTKAQTIASVAVNIGLLMVMAGTCLPLIRLLNRSYMPALKYVYAAGAVICLIGRLVTSRREMPDTRSRRLLRLEVWAALMFCVGAFFLFWPGAGPTDWLAFTLAGGMLQAYVSVMLPRAIRKGGEKGKPQR